TLRRILRPVYLAGGISVVLLAVGFIVTPFSGFGGTLVSVALIVTFTAVPCLFLAGLLGTTIARGAGLDTIFSSVPERAGPGEVQDGLRQALRDETAEVAYWYEERSEERRVGKGCRERGEEEREKREEKRERTDGRA